MAKKVLFFTSRLPLSPSSGREVSLYYYIKYLYYMYNMEIVVVSFGDENDIKTYPEFIRKVYTVKSPSNLDIGKSLLINTFLKGKPLQVSLFYSPKVQKKINEIIKEEDPDIVMADMVRTSEYFKDVNKAKIFDMDDMLSVRYEKQLKAGDKIINPFGAYVKKLPSFMKKILDLECVKKFILNYEYKSLQKYEIDICKYYNAVILVSERETKTLNKKLGVNKVFTVSTGVNCEYFSEKQMKKSENIISFLGVYSAPHNEDAVLYFYNEIFHIIKENNKNAKLRLVGGNVTENINKLKEDNSVEVIGRVEDVRDYIKSSKVFIAPLRFGSGIKTKILEAMAMGVPVVTTSCGADGMNVRNRKEVIIEDDPKKIASSICELMQNQNLYDDIVNNAQKYVIENYDWNVQMQSWKEVFKYVEERKC